MIGVACVCESVCACDGELANCIAVRAVVASSTRRRFVMMVSFPGRFYAPKAFSARAINSQRLGWIVAATTRRKLFILTSQRLNSPAVHGPFRRCFQIQVPSCPLRLVEGGVSCGGIGGRIGSQRSVGPAYRQLLRHLSRQLVRAWRRARLAHGRRDFGIGIAGRNSRRRLCGRARRCRRNFWRLDRHDGSGWRFPERQPRSPANVPGREPGISTHAGAWHTASMLCPSGSSTKAP
jgi:hypothetical protein